MVGVVGREPRRVLVVEDEPLIVMLIADMLEELGHAVAASCGTVEDALKLVETETFDVALLDLDLGGRSGYEVADVLAARGIAFVVMTGFTGAARAPYADRAVLNKPFEIDDLAQALENTVPSAGQ